MTQLGFVLDQRKCIGCHACTVACKAEHGVELGVFRTWVKYVGEGTFPDSRRHFAVMRCNQCTDAPCVAICPVKSLYKREDGIVDFDPDRCWDTVGRIVERVVADHLDERRLEGLACIGVDEISYRRHHRYLTSLSDHRCGAIVWCRAGRNSATLAEVFAELGARKDSIRAVSIDMSGEYRRAIREASPDAEICFDPFHVCRLASRATDQVRRDERNAHERSLTPAGRWVKGTRWSLLKAPERQTVGQLATLWEVQNHNRRLYRAFLLREELRLLPPTRPPPGARPSRRLARLGKPLPPDALHPARPHAPRAPRRHPRRHPPRTLQRPPRRPQLQDPPHQPPQPRLPLRRRPDRPRLPLPHRHRHHAAAMTSPTTRPERRSSSRCWVRQGARRRSGRSADAAERRLAHWPAWRARPVRVFERQRLGSLPVQRGRGPGMSQADAGLLLAGGSGLCVLVRVAAGAWIDRTGADPIFFMVGLMVAGAAGFVALSGSGQWLIVVAALVAFGAGWGWPGSSSSSS